MTAAPNRVGAPFPLQPFRTPALDAWRNELRKAERTPTDFDALWRAACAEMWSLDMAEYPSIAEGFRWDAVKILRDAAAQQGRGEPVL